MENCKETRVTNDAETFKGKRDRSVKSLTTLYTVVIGVALAQAVRGVIDPQQGLHSLSWQSTLLFLAFVVTLFPFFHGALRHLDDTYVESTIDHIRDGALVIDFFLLFGHALAFVVLSLLLKQPSQFAWCLVGLLSVDVVWGVFAHFSSSAKTVGGAEGKWTLINLVFILVGGPFLYFRGVGFDEVGDGLQVALPIAAFCALRSLLDYRWCWEFYFPRGNN
jgi:hypothetical protein